MPGDPKECRQQALACIRLAQTSASPQARDRFASLAWTWIRLADDLERNLTVLEGLDDWRCWQSDANPSLPVNGEIQGSFPEKRRERPTSLRLNGQRSQGLE